MLRVFIGVRPPGTTSLGWVDGVTTALIGCTFCGVSKPDWFRAPGDFNPIKEQECEWQYSRVYYYMFFKNRTSSILLLRNACFTITESVQNFYSNFIGFLVHNLFKRFSFLRSQRFQFFSVSVEFPLEKPCNQTFQKYDSWCTDKENFD